MAQEEQQLQKENSTEKEDEKSVNGKLDININENSVHNASEINTTEYHQLIDFKHNYHWFIELCAHVTHMAWEHQ